MCQTVEERHTVRDGQGNEKTTVTRSGGPGSLEEPDQQIRPVLPGQFVPPPFIVTYKLDLPLMLLLLF